MRISGSDYHHPFRVASWASHTFILKRRRIKNKPKRKVFILSQIFEKGSGKYAYYYN